MAIQASDKLRSFIEQMARFVIPGDDEGMQERVKDAIAESIYDEGDPDLDVACEVIAAADDEFLCSETEAFWDMIREARKLLRNPMDTFRGVPSGTQTLGLVQVTAFPAQTPTTLREVSVINGRDRSSYRRDCFL
jgi:hypothetical protein